MLGTYIRTSDPNVTITRLEKYLTKSKIEISFMSNTNKGLNESTFHRMKFNYLNDLLSCVRSRGNAKGLKKQLRSC